MRREILPKIKLGGDLLLEGFGCIACRREIDPGKQLLRVRLEEGLIDAAVELGDDLLGVFAGASKPIQVLTEHALNARVSKRRRVREAGIAMGCNSCEDFNTNGFASVHDNACRGDSEQDLARGNGEVSVCRRL